LEEYYLGKIIHTYGNHEMYNLKRTEIGERLGIPFFVEQEYETDRIPGSTEDDDVVGYWSFVQNKIRFIVLDTYDI